MAVADVRGHPALLERLGQHLAQAYEGTRPPANPHNLAAPRGFKDEHLRQLHQYQCWVQFELRGVPGALLPPTMRAECARVMVTEAEDNTISVSKLQQDVFIALKTSPLCRDRPAMVQDEYTIPELLALVAMQSQHVELREKRAECRRTRVVPKAGPGHLGSTGPLV